MTRADGVKRKIMRLEVGDFVRRFCLHLSPKRFVKIRHFGWLVIGNAKAKSPKSAHCWVIQPHRLRFWMDFSHQGSRLRRAHTPLASRYFFCFNRRSKILENLVQWNFIQTGRCA
jgi:hypothetical protein